MEQRATTLAERLRAELGDALRAVAIGDLERETYQMGHLRADIRDAYPESAREDIFREIVMEKITKPQQAELFEGFGAPRSTIRLFEDGAYVIYWHHDQFAFVSLSADESLLPVVIEACKDVFETE